MRSVLLVCAVLLLPWGVTVLADMRAEVKPHNGSPTLHVNGEPRVPLVFYGWAGSRGAKVVDVGPEWQQHHLTFIAPEDNDGSMGVHIRVGGGPPGTVWVDDVRLYPGEPQDDPPENMLRHGDWEGTKEEMESTWVLFQRIEDGADAEWDVDTDTKLSGEQSCRLTIRGGGAPGNFMHLHFYQTGMSVKQGQTYTYSLWLKSDEQRQADFHALHHGSPWTMYSRVPSDEYESQVQLAAGAGVHIHSFGIPLPWPKAGSEPDWRGVDDAVELTLRNDPEGLLMPRFGCAPPQWWLDEHPGHSMLFSDGETRTMSMASELWLEECLRNVRALVRHCEEKYGDQFIGYHPCGQHTGEWFYERSWESVLSDFSPAMQEGFRKWARGEYGTEAALREAWGDGAVTFEAASVPTADEQLATSIGFFRDPQGERKIIDYFRYKQLAMEQPLEAIARVIKEETDRQKLVVLFYGYTFDMHGTPMGPQSTGHLAMGRMLKCPDVDILTSPISYLDRELGGAGLFMSAVDSVRDSGKLWLNEDDTRTYLTPEESGYGRVDSPQGTHWVHQRNFAQMLPRRLACWYMDLGAAGWLDGPDIWENIDGLRQIYEQALPREQTWAPEVAVIVDEESPYYTKCDRAMHSPLVYQMRSQCARLGAPVRIHLMSDLREGRVPKAKAYLLLNCFHLSAEDRRLTDQACDGAAAVWFYGGGFLADGADDANLAPGTGMALSRGTPQPSRISVEDCIWTEGLQAETFGNDTVLDPLWTVEEAEGVEVIGRYADGTAAAAIRKGNRGLRAYIGSLHTPAKLLRNILSEAGVHLYSDTDDVIMADTEFLGIAATEAGNKRLMLPETSTVVDALSGETVAEGAREFELDMQLGETRLLWLREL